MEPNVVLAIWGVITIALVMVVLLKKWLSPVIALTIIPTVTALLSGISVSDLGSYANGGIRSVAPTAVMFLFAVLYFGLMNDVGLFDEPIKFIVNKTKGNPTMIFIGVFVVAVMTHLDGAGASTCLITVAAFKPIFDRLQLDKRKLVLAIGMAWGTMNNLPWGGPTLRMATVMGVEEQMVPLLFHPMIPAMVASLITGLVVIYFIGKSEMKGITAEQLEAATAEFEAEANDKPKNSKTKYNLLITAVAVAILLKGALPPFLIFALGLSIALIVNFGFDTSAHRKSIDSHAKAAVLMTSILFAAGLFTGVLGQSGMVESMALMVASVIPEALGQFMALFTALLAMTVGIFATTPDSFFFGIMPVIVSIGEAFNVDPNVIGRVAIFARNVPVAVSPLTPAVFLLVGLAEVDIGDHIRYSYKYLLIPSLVGLIVLFLF